MLRYWTGWQQVHEHLAKQTEGAPTVLSAGGSDVAIELLLAGAERARLALVQVSARVVGSP